MEQLMLYVFVFVHSRLALYVYEYLVYTGAQKAAQTFLQEVSHFWQTLST